MGTTLRAVVVAILVGLALGIAGFTFVYAKGTSYLTNDPRACANCHVMREQFDGWIKSSHHAAAGCNDCHTPHDPIAKYLTKASNGFWHSVAFTSGWFPDAITIKARNRRVTEAACRDCHPPMVQAIATRHTDDGTSCVHCHAEVGHLR